MGSNYRDFQLPDRNDPTEHIITEGLSFAWLHDGEIACLTISSMEQRIISAYFDLVPSIETSLGRDALLLFDLSQAGAPTPYFKARLRALDDQGVSADSKVAIVIPPGLGASLFLGFTRVFGRNASINAGTMMFQNRDKALRWLIDSMES